MGFEPLMPVTHALPFSFDLHLGKSPYSPLFAALTGRRVVTRIRLE